MHSNDQLVLRAARFVWLLPLTVLVLSLLSVEYYFDAELSFSWLWATNAIAVLWLTLEAYSRHSALPDTKVFLLSVLALLASNVLSGTALPDTVAMTAVNSAEIYLASYLFLSVINKGCSLQDGGRFARKVALVSLKLAVILGTAALIISVYLQQRYGAPVLYGAGAWVGSQLISYLFVFPILISVCNHDSMPHNLPLMTKLFVGFCVFEIISHLFGKPLLYDFIDFAVWSMAIALLLPMRAYAAMGFSFSAVELLALQTEALPNGLGPLQVNLPLSVVVAMSVATAIVMARSTLLNKLTVGAYEKLNAKSAQLSLILQSADITLFELDINSGDATLIEGKHPAMPVGTVIRIGDALASMIPSQADATQLRQTLAQDEAEMTYAVRYPGESRPHWSHIHTGRAYKRGTLLKRLVLRQDVTELMQTAEQLREHSERQKELFSVIGHELRTPVASMAMIADDHELSAPEKLTNVREISRNLLAVLEDLRTVVMPERARVSQESTAKPEAVIERALSAISHLASDNQVTVKFTHTASGSLYSIREQALRQLVTNLTKNAVIHSEGSEVLVSLTCTPGEDGCDRATLSVEDDGKGIPADQVERLFTAFSRGDTQKDGTGLGLFIAEELSAQLGGVLKYRDSERLGGACFSVAFPLKPLDDEAQAQAQAQAQASINLSGYRVLFAEDDRMLRMLTERALIKQGATIECHKNGQSALDAFKRADGAFDLVLTDLMMPQLDGYGLTSGLRAEGYTGPIIGVTAAVVGAETDRLLAVGASGVIAKPITIEKLVDELTRLNTESANV